MSGNVSLPMGPFSNLPIEINEIIFRLCSEEEQHALYLTCTGLRKQVDEKIFQVRLKALHIPTPAAAPFFPHLAQQYQTLAKFMLSKFLLVKSPESDDILQIKNECVLQCGDRVNQAFLDTFRIIRERIENHMGGLPALEQDDRAIQCLMEAGAVVPLPALVERPVGTTWTITELEDYLHFALAHKCSLRTIQFVLGTPNRTVNWAHVRNAIQRGHSDEVIVLLLNNVSGNIEPLVPEERCNPESLIPTTLRNQNISDKTKLFLLEKLEKFSFDVLREILDGITRGDEIKISIEVFCALMARVVFDSEPWHADYLITWFYNRSCQIEYLVKMGINLAPLEVLLDRVLQTKCTIDDTLRNPVIYYDNPDSFFYQQEAILYKLVCVTKAPIDTGTFEYALIHQHSDRVVLEMLKKCNPQESTTSVLDRALCHLPRPTVVGRLIEMGCKVDRAIVVRAFQSKVPDETILKVLEAYSGIIDFDLVTRVQQSAFQDNLSDPVIRRVIAWAESHLDEKTFSSIVDEALKMAKERKRSAELIAFLKSKSSTSCVIS